jgi:hypothetical protein
MENTASCKCNVRHFQWLALALWVWPELVNLINNLCKLFGCNNLLNMDWNTPAYYVYQTTVALTITASLILLSKLAAKPATTIVLRRVALPIMAIGLLSVYFDFYKYNNEVLSITAVGGRSLFYIVKVVILLYLYGVIYRENKEDKEGCKALFGYFWVSYIITWLVGNSFIFIQSIEVIYVLNIILSLTYLFFVYKFLTSAIFCGEKSCEPIEKGAFKFWNKFFKLWLIFFFGGSLLLGILGIIIN